MTKEEILHRDKCLTKIKNLLEKCEILVRHCLKKHPEFNLDYTLWNLKYSIYRNSEYECLIIQSTNKFWNLTEFSNNYENDYITIKAANKFWNLVEL